MEFRWQKSNEETFTNLVTFAPQVYVKPWVNSNGVIEEMAKIAATFTEYFFPDAKDKTLSRAIGCLDSDHILSRKQQIPLNAFRFVGVLGWTLILMFLVNLLILPLICALRDSLPKNHFRLLSGKFKRKTIDWHDYLVNNAMQSSKQESFKSHFRGHFGYYFWRTLVIAFGIPQIHIFRQRKCFLMLIWIFAIFILQNLLVGDMIGAIENKNLPLLIDSWDDLLVREDIESIIALNLVNFFGGKDLGRVNYFKLGTYKDAFTEKLDLKVGTMVSNETALKEALEKVDSGRHAFMYTKPFLKLFSGQNDRLHVSQRGGRTEPYFLISAWLTPDVVIEAIDVTIIRFTENGIYDKWFENFDVLNTFFSKFVSFDFKKTDLVLNIEETKSFFYVLFYNFAIASVLLLLEWTYWLIHRYGLVILSSFKILTLSLGNLLVKMCLGFVLWLRNCF